jgi:hypothetical protein
MMRFTGVVKNGVVVLPPDAHLANGTKVCVETGEEHRFADLLKLAGTWEGDDADRIVAEIYKTRSSAPARASFDE